MPFKDADAKKRHRIGYWKKYYADPVRKAKQQRRVRIAKTKRTARMRAWLETYKLDKGCVTCRFREHPAALDFAHRDRSSKLFNVGYAVGSNRVTFDQLKAEVDKCDVMCANCHRIATAKEGVELRGRRGEAVLG